MEEQEKYINALIELHSGLERQGPGDAEFTKEIIENIPELPPNPRIADIGCGAGAGTLILAKKYHSRIKAVDFSKKFLDELMQRAKQEGLENLVMPIECDMANLGWEAGTIDLLWSEGAAYNITFEGALKAWRPLLADKGIVVISELNYFSNNVPDNVTRYMKKAYPGIKTESKNIDLINTFGFEVIDVRRLPPEAWWNNYYGPLQEKIKGLKDSSDKVMQIVIEDTEEEMQFFREHLDILGYTFYTMRAI